MLFFISLISEEAQNVPSITDSDHNQWHGPSGLSAPSEKAYDMQVQEALVNLNSPLPHCKAEATWTQMLSPLFPWEFTHKDVSSRIGAERRNWFKYRMMTGLPEHAGDQRGPGAGGPVKLTISKTAEADPL